VSLRRIPGPAWARCGLSLALLPALAAPARADVDSRGELGIETRAFVPDGDARTDAGNVAAISRLIVDADADVKGLDDASFRARIFSRLDPNDSGRSLITPEELYLNVEFGPVRLRAGWQMLNWTATEAFHPADIMNSRILDSSFENPEKLGELILTQRLDIPNGNVEVSVMPLFVAPRLPTRRSPLNLAGPGVPLGEALVLEGDGAVVDSRVHGQWALQVQQVWGDADVSLHLVHQIDRQQPLFVFNPASGMVHPIYQGVTQLGGTYAHVIDHLILKLEGAYRRFDRISPQGPLGALPERDHLLLSVGAEYVLGLGDGSETSLLAEGQASIPTVAGYPEALEPLFQHDLMLGARHAFNDEQSTTLLATIVVDVAHPEQLLGSASISRRLGESWELLGGFRVFNYPPRDPATPQGFEHLHGQNHVYLNLSRHF
jgi:hypothetical protein